MLPEVVLLAELVDVISRHMDVVQPDVVGLVVIQVHGRVQPLRIETDPLGQKFPGPRNRLLLEIVSEGEIAQHLKIGAVPRRFADIFQVSGPDALLAGCDAPSRRDLLPREPGLHRCHAGIDNQ